MLQKITEEWSEFVKAHEQNRELMRFGYNRPKELLQKLTDLGREPVIFTAAEDYAPNAVSLFPRMRLTRYFVEAARITGLRSIPFLSIIPIRKTGRNT